MLFNSKTLMHFQLNLILIFNQMKICILNDLFQFSMHLLIAFEPKIQSVIYIVALFGPLLH